MGFLGSFVVCVCVCLCFFFFFCFLAAKQVVNMLGFFFKHKRFV